MAGIQVQQLIFIAAVVLAYHSCFTAGDDTPILPVPTTCPLVDPLNYTVHLQHETDCGKFYKCAHGNRVLFDCPSGLHFNPVLQVCDWPQSVNCSASSSSPSSSSASPSPSPTPAPSSSSIPPSPGPSSRCPPHGPLDRTIHLPHPTDCTKFFKCDNGKEVEFDCPSGLHFNPVLEVCDWPQDAKCSASSSSPSPSPSSSSASPSPSPTPAPSSSSIAPSPGPSSRCPPHGPLDRTIHLPHPSDCTKFFKCDNGKEVEFDCPSGLHFNPVLEVCDWPQDAKCSASSSSPSPSPSSSSASPSPSPTPAPSSSSIAPSPGPSSRCPPHGPLDRTIHLPHPSDCTKFFKCDNGKEVEFDCPSGLHFNPFLEVCDWPADAGCVST